MKSITSKISIIIVSLMACTFTFAEDKPAEEWLFVHTAENVEMTSDTTLVMPVEREIFAFTDRPNRRHAYQTAKQFAGLWADDKGDSFKADPPNAVLTWVDEEMVNEEEVVVTKATAAADGKSIVYEVKFLAGDKPTRKRIAGEIASLFIDFGSLAYRPQHGEQLGPADKMDTMIRRLGGMPDE
jgi:hypothetical protein